MFQRFIVFFTISVLTSAPVFALVLENHPLNVNRMQKKELSSLHYFNYFIFGPDDIKIQFSFKFRLIKSFPLYFAYSQLMLWDFYDESRPFNDVNFMPEVFYRFYSPWSSPNLFFDLGFMHLSNGRDKVASRSIDQLFLRTGYAHQFERHTLKMNLKLYNIYEAEENRDIVNHLGFWELSALVTDVLHIGSGKVNLELTTFAGRKVIDIDQGAWQFGLIYVYHDDLLNPSIYFQRYEGYSEHLLHYDDRSTEYRIGLKFSY